MFSLGLRKRRKEKVEIKIKLTKHLLSRERDDATEEAEAEEASGFRRITYHIHAFVGRDRKTQL